MSAALTSGVIYAFDAVRQYAAAGKGTVPRTLERPSAIWSKMADEAISGSARGTAGGRGRGEHGAQL
jgi:hypothetical protein